MASEHFGRLVLRLALGVLVLLHGISKMVHGPGFVATMVANAHLPHVLTYGVYVGEVLAPALIILGLWTRPAALIVCFNMLMAVYLVHRGQLMSLNETGGWALELQGFIFATALALACLGAGRFSVAGDHGRLN